jgi:hypothetical protein
MKLVKLLTDLALLAKVLKRLIREEGPEKLFRMRVMMIIYLIEVLQKEDLEGTKVMEILTKNILRVKLVWMIICRGLK